MKQMITILAASLLALSAFADQAAVQDASQIDKNVQVIVCGASTLVNEAALPMETLTQLDIYAIDVLSGDQVDAGHYSSPFQLQKTSTSVGTNGTVVNNYDVVGSTEKATVTFIVGATAADIKITSVVVGTSIFLAPTLTKDQATTDSIVKAGNAGFSCSAGVADILAPISDLAF
jgi:hypothetical protein